MPLRNFTSDGRLQIEVNGETSAGDYGAELTRALAALIGTVNAGMSQIHEEERPQETKLTCGLQAVAGGGYAVLPGTGNANFVVTLTWRTDSQSSLFPPDILLPPE